MAKRAQAGRRTAPRRTPATIADLVRKTAARLRAAKLVFAHGTTDPRVEAAFLVCEAMGLPPERFNPSSRTRVSAATRDAVYALVDARVRTRKPAAYLVHKAYLQGVPFYVDERVIVPRSF